MPATPAQNNTLDNTFGETIKQYGGPVQVTRAVKVKAPGMQALQRAHRRRGQEGLLGHGGRIQGAS